MSSSAPSPHPDLRRALESLPDPFFTLDGQWRLTFLNDHAARFVLRGADDLLGQVFWEAFPETLGTRFETGMRRARDERRTVEYEEHYAPLNRWVEVRVFPDGDGVGVHYRDITARRVAQERSQALAQVAQDLVAATTPRAVADVLTGEICAVLGAYSAVVYEVSGEELCELARRGLDAPRTWRRFALAEPHLPALVARDGEARFLREADFQARYPEVPRAPRTRAAAVLPLVAGSRLIGVLAYSYDAEPAFDESEQATLRTLGGQGALALERARQTHAAREREERYRVVSQVTNDALWEWTFDGDRVTWNDGLYTLYGYARHEVEPTAWWWKAQIHPDDRSRVLRGIEAVIHGAGEVWRDEYRFRRSDGTFATVIDRGRVLRDSAGQATHMIGGMTDLSERERHREEIEALNASLEVRVSERTETLRVRAAELQAETDALSAFAGFMGAVGNETELTVLAARAVQTLIRAFEDGSAVYYTREGEVWQGTAWAGDLSDGTLALVQGGLALNALTPDPSLRGPRFVDGWAGAGGEVGEQTPEYGAAAFYPVWQGQDLCGLLTAGLKRAPSWAPRDRAVFQAVGHGLSLAAERASVLHRLDEERAATAAFAAFTEAVGTETDLGVLARQAVDVLHAALDDLNVGYYELKGDLWRARVLSPDVPPQVARAARAGFPADMASFDQAVGTRDVLFVDDWATVQEQMMDTGVYRTAAFSPYFSRGRVSGLLTMASGGRRSWGPRARAVFTSVARGLALAFERAETARVLQEQNAELHARTLALEGFADLARDLAFESDPATLIRRAQEIVLGLLPQGAAFYYEPQGGRWWARVQTGSVGNPELQAAIDAGLPFGDAGNLVVPWRTGEPYFQESYAPDTDQLPGQTTHIGSTATVPLVVRGAPRGIFAVALFGTRRWDATDRAVMETAGRHLALALERAEIVAELGAQRAALQASNEELEAFSYTVSHDLRAPLRHVAGFAGMLRRALDSGDRAKAERALGVIEDSVARGGALIDALLDFSRLSKQDLRRSAVELEPLVRGLFAQAQTEAPRREVVWVLHELPTVQGDAALLRQVFANLLSNAVKYSARAGEVRVEVGSELRENELALYVRDSGAGFHPGYADKLFGVFQRLHSDQEFPGTGIGLATVRRIVERHGGRVWAEGEPGQGATFWLALPHET